MNKKINLSEIEWQMSEQGDFSSFRKLLGVKAGGRKLGASLYKLLPGKKAFPFHCHYANEEAILVLSGKGTLRLNQEKIIIQQDDYIALLCGSEYAHQVINTSTEPLIYLCFSTMIEPDVMEYPDSNKIGIMVGTPPGGEKNQRSNKGFYHKETAVSYYDREE